MDSLQHFFLTNNPIAYQSQTMHCLIYAVLNAAYNPGEAIHDKLQDAFGCSHGSVRQLAEASSAISVTLGKVKNTSAGGVSLEWLLSQSTGIYILYADGHCISVDVSRQLVFDCAYPFALSFTRDALVLCGFETFSKIRRATYPNFLSFIRA